MYSSAKLLFLAFFGLSAGGVIAAGVFAFLAVIGVYPRLIGKTGTKKHVRLYETFIVAGGIVGNLVNLFGIPAPLGGMPAKLLLFFFGGAVGVFVGCLVMSPGRDVKCPAGDYPAHPPGCGIAVYYPGGGAGEGGRVTLLFLAGDWERVSYFPQHFLYFFPLLQGQGSGRISVPHYRRTMIKQAAAALMWAWACHICQLIQ